MLNLVKSNRMEHLVKGLCATLEQVPLDPMVPEWIGIQSRGMKQWLTTVLAGHFGICANVSFLFPRQILEQVIERESALAAGKPDSRPALSRDMMTWAVMRRLTSPNAWPPALWGAGGPLGYVADDPEGRKTWQLSRSIARVFDDYQVYRPDLLARWGVADAWEQEEADAAWQAWLWQDLAASGRPLLSGLDALIHSSGNGPVAPETQVPGRICLFGISAMPIRFLEAFSALARTRDIFIFLLTPSDQFFFDLGSDKQRHKAALDSGNAPELPGDEAGSPLLRALGKSGREFHGILENFDYHEPFGELFEDPAGQVDGTGSMLAVLQSDILTLADRGEDLSTPPLPVSPDDISVCLHACHSPMRQAQVLKDRILDFMDRDPGISPHDIIVMMPDIEAYAPFLEAVFSQEPRLPFTVSDRKRRSESRTVDAFLKILALRGSRLEKSGVMALLTFPAIADKFGIPGPDRDRILAALDQARVFWGKNRAHRDKICGMAFEENTWAFGLSRLVMGTALPAGEGALAGSVLPCDGFEGLEADILGRFSHFMATLFKGLDSLEEPRTLGEWGRCLRWIVLSMLADDGQGDMAFVLTALDDVCQDGHEAGVTDRFSFPMIEAALTDKLDQSISQGSFMAGSITFCNLMPMRSIPFKVVCLMGMDEKGFPRQAREPGFNLMARFPRIGDKQVRAEDCYLFLESLMSARTAMVITYTGMGISDNAPIPCAGPVSVLKDTMAKTFAFESQDSWIFTHPLHPFSPVYFDGKRPGFFSFSLSQRDIAAAQSKFRDQADQTGRPARGLNRPGNRPGNGQDNDAVSPMVSHHLDIKDLIGFFRRPAKTFVRKRLGLQFPDVAEAEAEREDFQVSGLAQYSIGTLCLDTGCDPGLFERVKAAGLLPLGRKGQLEWQRIQALCQPVLDLAAARFPSGAAGSLGVSLEAGGLIFSGQVPDVIDTGRYVTTFGKPTPDRLLAQWIFHLFYCAVSEGAGQTWLAGRDPKGRQPACAVGFASLDSEQALRQIQTLGRLYLWGMDAGPTFACAPCFYLAQALAKQNFDLTDAHVDTALSQARPFWTGGFYQAGEAADRYTAIVFGDMDPFADVGAIKESGLLDTGLAVFQPMIEAMMP